MTVETRLKKVEKELEGIRNRNKHVELDKAWELSITRKILLILFTYLAVFAYLYAIGIKNAVLNAIVPALAFMLSTFTLPWFKTKWISSQKGRKA